MSNDALFIIPSYFFDSIAFHGSLLKVSFYSKKSNVLFPFPLGVEGFVDFFEAFVGDVGVDLRGRDGGVPEHRLDAPDIGAVDEEVGRETVAERVRVHVFQDTGFLGIAFHQTLDAPRRETLALSRGIGPVDETFLAIGDEERRIDIGALVEVGLERCLGSRRDEYDAKLASFAADAELFLVEIQVSPVEIHEFRYAEPRREEQLEHRLVAERFLISPISRGDQALHFFEFEEVHLPVRRLADLDFFRGERGDILFGEVFEKGAEHYSLVGLGILFQRPAATVVFAVEVEAVFAHLLCGDIGRGPEAAPGEKGTQRAVVAIDRSEGAVHLDFQMLEEALCVFLERRLRFCLFFVSHTGGKILCDIGIVPYVCS